MYQRARSLGQWEKYNSDMRFILIEQQQEAYALAINALCLLDPGDAWISLATNEDEPSPWPGSGEFGAEERLGDGSGTEIVELSDMRREFELCKARRDLAILYLASGYQLEESGSGEHNIVCCGCMYVVFIHYRACRFLHFSHGSSTALFGAWPV